MKNYYVSQNGSAQGPLTQEEVLELELPEQTHIWTDDATEWKPIADFPELKKIVAKASMPPPPPPPVMQKPPQLVTSPVAAPPVQAKKESSTASKVINWVLAPVALLVLVIYLLSVFGNDSDATNQTSYSESTLSSTPARELTPEELREQLRQRELNMPLDYLGVSDFQTHVNIIGETVLYGNIYNTASTATYKDVQLTFSFLSKSDTELYTHQERVYEYLTPSGTAGYKFKIHVPVSYSTVSVRVTRAKPVG